jgi:dihydrofolate synthase/folylpolyglutamate synthase
MTLDRNPWLESLIRPTLRPYSERAPAALESVARLLDRLGNPHARLRVVHIAGSKGKGATALMVEALLNATGVRTGTFTSPHLERWTERFRIDGREISRTDLDQAIVHLRPHVAELSQAYPRNPPSFFDTLTAMALWLFERRGVEVAIIETGIGGRYDATNIVRPEVACITNIELEHCDKLGTDLASIARHKAGILKPGAVAVLGSFDPASQKVIREKVIEAGCKSAWIGVDFEIVGGREAGNGALSYRSGDLTFEFARPHPSCCMAENAALAMACVQRLKGVESAHLKNAAGALSDVSLPGRCEILRSRPWWIVDCAHTKRSVTALVDVLAALPATDRHFLVSLSGDKTTDLLAPLLDTATSVTVTSPEALRSAPAAELASQISTRYPGAKLLIEENVEIALERAMSQLGPSSLLCATGSTYVAGAIRRLLRSSADGTSVQASSDRSSVILQTKTQQNRLSPSENSPSQFAERQEAADEVRSA